MVGGWARRCLASLAEWERLSVLVRKEWRRQESAAQREMAPLAAHAAWHMGHWDEMGTFVDTLKALEKPATSEVAFLEAVLHVRRDDHAAARGAGACAPVLCGGALLGWALLSYPCLWGNSGVLWVLLPIAGGAGAWHEWVGIRDLKPASI